VGWGLLERIARGQERSMRHPRLRLEAIKLLIAYGVGKPRESVELSSADGEPLAPAAPAIDFSWATKEQLWALLEFSEKSAAEDAKPKEE
jgi:hypothetical protein